MDFDINDITSSMQAFIARSDELPRWVLTGAVILIIIILGFMAVKIAARMLSAKRQNHKKKPGPRTDISPSDNDAGEDYTAHIVEISVQALAFIQMQIDGDPDKRHQKIYQKHSAKRPIARISALHELRRISDRQEQALRTILRLSERFNQNRTSNRGAPRAVYDLVKSNWIIVQSHDD